MNVLPLDCAREILEVVPLIMRTIRTKMRSNRTIDLSVPQFRTLIFLNRHGGASLSDLADHIGLTLPSISKMVDGLLSRELITREEHPSDRRRITLNLTEYGRDTLQTAYAASQEHLADLLENLSGRERITVIKAMRFLQPLFTPGSSNGGMDTKG